MPPPPYPPRDPRQARAYYRAQRYYWRAWRRPSIVGPIVLLAVGIMALLVESGRVDAPTFWAWYGQWWPLLLIGIGVLLLIEWFADRNHPYAGRRSARGLGFIIVLLILAGWGAHAAHVWGPFSDQFSHNGDNFFFMMGPEHDNDVQLDQAIAAHAVVQINNPRGDVTVTASDDGQMHVHAHQVVHTSSDSKAQRSFKELNPQLTATGSSAVLTVPGRNNAHVNLVVEVPPGVSLTINAGHGDVSVEGLTSHADVTAGRGDVRFDSIGGDVHARMNHGDFSAHQIGGHAYIDGHGGDITLSDVKGGVAINGEFFGDTHVEQAGSAVHFHSSRTQIDVAKLGGDFTMDSGDLTIGQPAGPVRIVTRSKDIEITHLTGDAHIENSNGDVNLTAAEPLGNIEIANHIGGVSLTVPENASFSVNATTSRDESIQTDFPLTASVSGGERTLRGQIGKGGPTLNLTTDHGDLQLRKGGLSAPEPPVPPKAPGVKHLKAPKGVSVQTSIQ